MKKILIIVFLFIASLGLAKDSGILDAKISLMHYAVKTNDPGDGLGALDWSALSKSEKERFFKTFTNLGEDIAITKYKGREFQIKIINYE